MFCGECKPACRGSRWAFEFSSYSFFAALCIWIKRASLPVRERVWQRLATDLKPLHPAEMTRVIEFDALPNCFDDFIAGRAKGRTVVRIAS
jgi:hypothetical protein